MTFAACAGVRGVRDDGNPEAIVRDQRVRGSSFGLRHVVRRFLERDRIVRIERPDFLRMFTSSYQPMLISAAGWVDVGCGSGARYRLMRPIGKEEQAG